MLPIFAAALVVLASGAGNANICGLVSSTPLDVIVFEDTAIGDEGELIASVHVDPSAPSWVVATAAHIRLKYRLGKGMPWIYLGRVSCADGATLKII